MIQYFAINKNIVYLIHNIFLLKKVQGYTQYLYWFSLKKCSWDTTILSSYIDISDHCVELSKYLKLCPPLLARPNSPGLTKAVVGLCTNGWVRYPQPKSYTCYYQNFLITCILKLWTLEVYFTSSCKLKGTVSRDFKTLIFTKQLFRCSNSKCTPMFKESLVWSWAQLLMKTKH